MKRRTVIGVSAAVVVVGGVLWTALRPRAIPVEVEAVTPGPLRVTVSEDGRVRVRDRYVLSSPLAGTLLRPAVRAGDPCTPGTTLARIVPVAPPLLDARTRSEVQARAAAANDAAQRAEAALALARSELEQADRNLARARQLGAAGSISQEAMERIQTDRGGPGTGRGGGRARPRRGLARSGRGAGGAAPHPGPAPPARGRLGGHLPHPRRGAPGASGERGRGAAGDGAVRARRPRRDGGGGGRARRPRRWPSTRAPRWSSTAGVARKRWRPGYVGWSRAPSPRCPRSAWRSSG